MKILIFIFTIAAILIHCLKHNTTESHVPDIKKESLLGIWKREYDTVRKCENSQGDSILDTSFQTIEYRFYDDSIRIFQFKEPTSKCNSAEIFPIASAQNWKLSNDTVYVFGRQIFAAVFFPNSDSISKPDTCFLDTIKIEFLSNDQAIFSEPDRLDTCQRVR
jgi:hypothetical protein